MNKIITKASIYGNSTRSQILSIVLLVFILSQSCANQNIMLAAKYLPSQELNIEVEDSIYISGTLSYVSAKSLIIMIAGSGPTNRDCNNNMGLKTDAFKMLASHFESIGISSYRYDKRGIAKSTAVPETSLTMDVFAQDVNAIIEHFKNDFEKVILLGHSEGVLIRSMVAKENELVSSFVAIAGIALL